MSYLQQRVRKFHERMGQQDPKTPTDLSWDERVKRARIDAEEYVEKIIALIGTQAADRLFGGMIVKVSNKRGHDRPGDLQEIVHESIDCYVVTAGTLVCAGVDDKDMIDLICDANDAKVGGGKDENGKFRKPEGWKPADLLSELVFQGWRP